MESRGRPRASPWAGILRPFRPAWNKKTGCRGGAPAKKTSPTRRQAGKTSGEAREFLGSYIFDYYFK